MGIGQITFNTVVYGYARERYNFATYKELEEDELHGNPTHHILGYDCESDEFNIIIEG